MAVDLICPDCGGVIGATGIDSSGRGPCTCFKEEAVTTRTESGSPVERDDPSDTVSLPSQQQPAEQAGTAALPKLCITCGKNVTGHRRVKDSRGYMCYDCAKKEVKAEKEGTVPCGECGRRMKEAGLLFYKGKKICRSCYDHNKEIDQKNRKVATKEIDEYEKRNVIILAIIFGILGLIVIWQTLKHFL